MCDRRQAGKSTVGDLSSRRKTGGRRTGVKDLPDLLAKKEEASTELSRDENRTPYYKRRGGE